MYKYLNVSCDCVCTRLTNLPVEIFTPTLDSATTVSYKMGIFRRSEGIYQCFGCFCACAEMAVFILPVEFCCM